MEEQNETKINKEDCAKSYRDLLHSDKDFAARRSSELADEFTRLEVQIATLLIAFAGISLNSFSEGVEGLSLKMIIILKLIYTFGVFLLIMSLALGLIHLKRKEKFWNEILTQKTISRNKWIKVLEKKEVTFEEARAFQDGTILEKGAVISSPLWTWVIQTVCLVMAFGLFFILFLALLFIK